MDSSDADDIVHLTITLFRGNSTDGCKLIDHGYCAKEIKKLIEYHSAVAKEIQKNHPDTFFLYLLEPMDSEIVKKLVKGFDHIDGLVNKTSWEGDSILSREAVRLLTCDVHIALRRIEDPESSEILLKECDYDNGTFISGDTPLFRVMFAVEKIDFPDLTDLEFCSPISKTPLDLCTVTEDGIRFGYSYSPNEGLRFSNPEGTDVEVQDVVQTFFDAISDTLKIAIRFKILV